MKKYLLVSMAIFTITIACSQTEKGKKIICAQFNVSGNDNSNVDNLYSIKTNSLGFQIVPGFGYFISDNIAVGVNLKVGISNTKSVLINSDQIPDLITTNKSSAKNYGGGVFAKYYKKITTNLLFSLNGEASFSYQTTKLEHSTNDPWYVASPDNPAIQEVQLKSVFAGISPGLVYFISPKLGISTNFSSFYFNNSSSKNISVTFPNDNKVNSYGFNFSITTLYLGLNYNF